MTEDKLAIEPERAACDLCGEGEVMLSEELQRFNYGPVEENIVLEALVPVWTCAACGGAYLGEEAAELMHDAVCRHLDRLTPKEVKAIRVSFGLRQEEFAELTGNGVASIKRWESGAQIPSRSADQYLKLYRRLGVEKAKKYLKPRPTPEFTRPFSDEEKKRARRFQLRTQPARELDMAA